MRIMLVAPLALLLAGTVQADEVRPFGMAAGMTMAELSELAKQPRRTKVGINVPTPNPHFATYFVDLTEAKVVCGVSALGTGHPDDMMNSLKIVQTELQTRYPTLPKVSVVYQTQQYEGISDAQAILSGDAFLFGATENNLPYPLERISLTMGRGSRDDGTLFLSLSYQFQGYDDCETKRRQSTSQPNRNSAGL